jgi:hypothetical protein
MTYNGDPSQQYSAPQQQYPQQPQQPYGYNQQPQLPRYGNYQQPAAALPTIWPTLLITFFFGIFGIIPAVMCTTRGQGRQAARPTTTGNPDLQPQLHHRHPHPLIDRHPHPLIDHQRWTRLPRVLRRFPDRHPRTNEHGHD